MKIFPAVIILALASCAVTARTGTRNLSPETTMESTNAGNFIQDDQCRVSDPTGTLLNVRSKPNGGKIVRRLKNGTKVFVVNEMADEKDRAWSKISLSNKGNAPIIGWVLREYLDCQ